MLLCCMKAKLMLLHLFSCSEAVVWGRGEQSHPLDECLNRCNERGACMRYVDEEDTPTCWCYHGFSVSERSVRHECGLRM